MTTTTKEPRGSEKFLLAGRDVPWGKASLAIAANWIWAPALFVAAQQGYQHGWVGVFWFTVPNVLCLVLFGFVFKRAREVFPDGVTLSGLASKQYSSRVQKVYLGTLAGLATCSLAVQMVAGGAVLAELTPIPYPVITLALAVVAVAYSVRSGLSASLVAKVIGMSLIALLGVGLALTTLGVAGLGTLAEGLTGIGRDMTSLTSGAGTGVFWAFGLSTSIGLISGPFGDQSFWQIGFSIRSAREARRAFLVGAGIFALAPLGMSILGFLAAGASLKVDDPQLTNLTALLHWLPGWVVVPFVIYIVAGLLSTLDSQLCSVSSLVGHDLSKGRAPASAVRYGRMAMIFFAVLAVLIANLPGIAVVQLFIFYGTLRASTLVPTILAVYLPAERLNEKVTFWSILSALVLALPVSAYGNLTGTVPAIVEGSLAVIAISGVPSVIAALRPPRA